MSSHSDLYQLSIHASCRAQLNILGAFVECCCCSDHWMIYLKPEKTTHYKLSHRMSTKFPKHLVYIDCLFAYITRTSYPFLKKIK